MKRPPHQNVTSLLQHNAKGALCFSQNSSAHNSLGLNSRVNCNEKFDLCFEGVIVGHLVWNENWFTSKGQKELKIRKHWKH